MKPFAPFDLSQSNTFGLTSHCSEYIEVSCLDNLEKAVKSSHFPIKVLGDGSNIILPHQLDCSVIKITANTIKVTENAKSFFVSVDAGHSWDQFVQLMLARGINGLENLAAIPGTVGAAPIQNIGAYGVEVERFIHSVEYYSLDTHQWQSVTKIECRFGYRDSIFKNALKDKAIVTRVTFELPKSWIPILDYTGLKGLSLQGKDLDAQTIYDTVTKIRWDKLPKPSEIGNTGSFFKNPVLNQDDFDKLFVSYPKMPHYFQGNNSIKVPAAWLIDQAGLKGYTYKGVATYYKQPLVLTNRGHATYQDVLEVIEIIQSTVQDKFDVLLQPEVQLW